MSKVEVWRGTLSGDWYVSHRSLPESARFATWAEAYHHAYTVARVRNVVTDALGGLT